MNVLFVHDHKFRRIRNELYSPGGLSNEILSRYLRWFDELTAVGRIIDEDKPKSGYSKIVNPKVRVTAARDLRTEIRRADCIIARLPSVNGFKAIQYAKKEKKPYLVEIVGCAWDSYWNHSFKGKLFAIPAFLIMKALVRGAPYVLYVTKEFLQARYPSFGNTVAISDVALLNTEVEINNRLGRNTMVQEKIILGTAAAIDVTYKGQEYVIRALPLLKKALQKDIEYQLVGSGNADRLKKIAEECGVESCLNIKGVLPHEDVFYWMDGLDVYIQPSLQEGLCRALLEAMSRGVACVASKSGGNPELLAEQYLFSVASKSHLPEEICSCIVELLKQNNFTQSMEQNYYTAKNYDQDHLERLRDQFYQGFAQIVAGETA